MMMVGGGSKSEFGFDLGVARKNLLLELIELGTVSHERIVEWKRQAWAAASAPIDIEAQRTSLYEAGIIDPALVDQTCEHWRAENRRRQSLSDEDVEWDVARQAADVHALLHGVPVLIDGKRAPFCPKWPCMQCGVSYALFELCVVAVEQHADAKVIADCVAQLAQGLRRLKGTTLIVEDLLARSAKRHDALAAHVSLKEEPWNDLLAGVRLIAPLTELLGGGQARARKGLMSRELRNARPGARGRRKYWTLTAVSQHLGHGGYQQSRIASLVPDDAGGTDEARVERVRHRLADDDSRSIIPEPPLKE
jgi:hypothetical protein